MALFILRCAVDDNGGRWDPGTILDALLPQDGLSAGERGAFLLIKVQDLTGLTLADFKALRLAKKIDLDDFLTAEEQATYATQIAAIRAAMIAGEEVGIEDLIIQGDISAVHMWASVNLSDNSVTYPDPVTGE